MKKYKSFVEYMHSPSSEKWIETLIYWCQYYSLAISENKESILNLEEFIVINDTIDRFPKAIIYLIGLKNYYTRWS